MNVMIEPTWKQVLHEEFDKPYFLHLVEFLKQEKSQYIIYPPGNKIFAAFNYAPFDKVKVVILGQDPYHGQGQANGLCFSVERGVAKPPSLQNIFKELNTDVGAAIPLHGDLQAWAKQGVLLLNAILTVRANQAASHQQKGWETFTDTVIQKLSEQRSGLVFMLWGNFAKQKAVLIDSNKHHVLMAAHPSPLARGAFFGCKHFSTANQFLSEQGQPPINWKIV
ncbi:MAG: uracil-DNA glycosylase [Bacteroidetes bacterium]|nr:uracil-DNA glycosylase [Bacteroidota bacterium]